MATTVQKCAVPSPSPSGNLKRVVLVTILESVALDTCNITRRLLVQQVRQQDISSYLTET